MARETVDQRGRLLAGGFILRRRLGFHVEAAGSVAGLATLLLQRILFRQHLGHIGFFELFELFGVAKAAGLRADVVFGANGGLLRRKRPGRKRQHSDKHCHPAQHPLDRFCCCLNV